MKILQALAIFLISSITPVHLLSQNFKNGYIVNPLNDTIKGYIKENTDNALLEKIVFSVDSPASKIIEYLPAELKGFGFSNGRRFEKFTFKEFNGKDSIETSVVAKSILTGKINLYVIQSNKKEEYILKNRTTGKIVHLQKPKEKPVRTDDGKTFTSRDIKYLQYLTSIKQDASTSFVKQEDIRYTKKEIVNNIKKYDQNYTQQFPVTLYKEQKQISFSILGGYPAFKLADVSNRYRFSFYWDKMLVEQTLKLSFIQGISYSQYIQYHNKEALTRVISIFPLGLRFQTKPMVVTPYFYFGLGAQLITMPFYEAVHDNSVPEVASRHTYPSFSLNLGTGLNVKITSRWHALAEVSCKFFLEGIFLNGGLSYQLTR